VVIQGEKAQVNAYAEFLLRFEPDERATVERASGRLGV
jgi:hypothetical protein